MSNPNDWPIWKSTRYVEFAEGTPKGSFALDSGRVPRRIKVEWDPFQNLIQQAIIDFLGYAELRVTGGVTWIHRETPHKYRNFPNRSGDFWLWCTSVPGIEGIAPLSKDDNDTQTYRLAELQLQYTSLTYKIVEDSATLGTTGMWSGIPDEARLLRYVTRLPKPMGKILTLPQGMMRVQGPFDQPGGTNAYGAKPGIIREGLPFRVGGAKLTYIHHVRPDVPSAAIQNCLNTVNNAVFDGFYPAETLLFEDVDIKPFNSPLGDRVYDIHYFFKYQPNVSPVSKVARGHNFVLRKVITALGPPVTAVMDYVPITTDGQARNSATDPTNTPFRLTDFNSLFRPDQ